MAWIAPSASAQVPPNIEAELRKIGQIVDPGCTAKLYRPMMPKNDYDTYWPSGASAPAKLAGPLYSGVTLMRDVSFGPNPKDLIDIFAPEKGSGNLTVLIYVPGGAGNKIEQQDQEGHAFYDNIGRWATENDMVGVTMQRHPGANWDDGGKDISRMIQWLQANITKYKGDPDRMFIWAHSAGNGPLGVYIGHPEIHGPKGVGVRGAIFLSGNPVPGVVAPAAAPARGGAALANPLPGAGVACGMPPAAPISGPSGITPAPAAAAGAGGRGAPVDAATQAARSNLPGFKATNVAILIGRAELDPGVTGGMVASDTALHDELCKQDGAAAKDGVGHCPTMVYFKGESHMSEVFSIDSPDKSVSGPILAWIRKTK
jgi:triacylglycerol lipase